MALLLRCYVKPALIQSLNRLNWPAGSTRDGRLRLGSWRAEGCRGGLRAAEVLLNCGENKVTIKVRSSELAGRGRGGTCGFSREKGNGTPPLLTLQGQGAVNPTLPSGTHLASQPPHWGGATGGGRQCFVA